MKVLILSCNTGEGHNSAAKAAKEQFDECGIECYYEDSLAFVSKRVSGFVSGGHIFMYRYAPFVFKFGYKFSEKHRKVFAKKSLTYRIFARGSKKLYEYCKERGIDVILSSHVFSSMIVMDMLEKYSYNAKSYFIATDYTCAPGVDCIYSDGYFIPHRTLAGDFTSHGINGDALVSSGIPIRKMFGTSLEKEEAKERVGLPKDSTHLLVMCGSMGCGPIKKLAGKISEKLEKNQYITVVCGTNKKLFNRLSKKFKNNGNVYIRAYVNDMSILMDSADLCITKPGGISVTEAASKKLPMVFVDAVAGCEKYNLEFFVKLGGAVTAGNVNALSDLCLKLMKDKKALEKMQNSFGDDNYRDSSKKIYEYIMGNTEVDNDKTVNI